jgi:hypothetical protein
MRATPTNHLANAGVILDDYIINNGFYDLSGVSQYGIPASSIVNHPVVYINPYNGCFLPNSYFLNGHSCSGLPFCECFKTNYIPLYKYTLYISSHHQIPANSSNLFSESSEYQINTKLLDLNHGRDQLNVSEIKKDKISQNDHEFLTKSAIGDSLNKSSAPVFGINQNLLKFCNSSNSNSKCTPQKEEEISQISEFFDKPPSSYQEFFCNIDLIKNIFFQYFYEKNFTLISPILNDFELRIVQVMLIKKLVHDKKKSKVYSIIRNLGRLDLAEFLNSNPALNRKNIIKSNLFKRVWKILERRKGVLFHEHYFSQVETNDGPVPLSIKLYRKFHSFNLSDNFYKKCFASKQFAEDFFNVLEDKYFRNSILKSSQTKFLGNFESWISEIIIFLQKGFNAFSKKTRLPSFKFGISMNDFDAASSLFSKVISED